VKLKRLFLLLFIVNISFLSLLVFIISDYHKATTQMEDAYKMQHKSLILANELRQSSDDLTRVARTYVITGNKMYEEQFHTILDIRNGIIPRPKNYNSIYWDFLTINGSKPSLEGKIVALRDLMKQAGFQEAELALLYKSQQESDDLTYLEIKAMNAIKGIFQDDYGFYTQDSKPNFEMARDIMHSQKYHKAKIAIMKPLDQFYKAFKHRTNKKVEETKNEVHLLERYVSFSILFLIVLVLFSSFIILSRIIYPLETLKNAMLRLAKNDMEAQIPVHENNDEVSEMIGTVEIFKKNAIELIHSEQKNKSILDLAGDGIFGLDEKGKLTFLNPMACKLLGFSSQEELIGEYLYESIILRGLDSVNKKFTRNEKLMLSKKMEVSFKKLNKSVFPIKYVSTPIYNKKKILLGSVVVFSDITKEKKNEKQLKKAIKDAKDANDSKSIFLANMSHELRTPLNAILGFAQLLKDSRNINSSEKENLNTIHSSGEHLLRIINEILQLSKIEAGKIDMSIDDFNLYDCVDELKQMFHSRYKNKNLTFSVNISEDVPKYIRADEQMLKQIIINLLANALKFTSTGGATLNIELHSSQLLFEIIDTGIGIDNKHKKLIFQPFEQINTNSNIKTSTGLGLSITKKLISKMGGNISLVSTPNKGSKFHFHINFEVSKKRIIKEIDLQKRIIGISGPKDVYTILVVDDIKENRMLIDQMLSLYGFKIKQAQNCEEAIQIFKNHQIDLIFMDILMPSIDGIETSKRIRNLSKGKDIPIIAVSAHAFKKDEEIAIKAGINSFLTKPIQRELIVQTIQQYLKIEFIYEENIQENQKFDLKNISEELLLQIKRACKTLDTKTIEALINTKDCDKLLYSQIKNYLLSYNFQNISYLCEKLLSKKI